MTSPESLAQACCALAQYLTWFLPLFLIYCAAEAFVTRKRVGELAKHALIGAPLAPIPAFLHNLNFAIRASKILRKDYHQLPYKFKKSTFQLIRNDGNILVLPQSLLDELSVLPASVASPNGALEHDLLGHYTGLNLILENRLHHSIVQRRLTPRLPLLVPRLETAARTAFDRWLPKTEEWSKFQPYQVLGQVSARITAEVVVGPKFRDNAAWLDISFNYTENLFRTIVILRLFPDWLKPMIAPMLPSYWNSRYYIKTAKSLLSPTIQDLIDRNEDGLWAPEDDNADDLNILSWTAALAKGRDRDAAVISHVQVLVALAAVHTTLLRMVNVLYDITAAGSTLREALLAEIASVPNECWADGSAYDKLHRLDSVMRESQRIAPPTTLGIKRLFKEPHTFRDGTHIPAETYVCMPITAIENDAENTPNPERYDGLRSFRSWEAAVAAGDKIAAKNALFTTPTPTVLSFGYGKTACPGRFFAGTVIKIVLVKMLTEYDFAFLAGSKGRPGNIEAHEFLFTWPWQKMLFRRKQEGSCLLT